MRSFWLLALGLALPAMASIESELARCAVISDKLDRLICYDNLAQASNNSLSASAAEPVGTTSTLPNTPTTSSNEPATAADSRFGKTQIAQAEPDRIELEVAKTEKDQYGNLRLTFTNGQIWKQTESRKYKLSVGDKVFIEKGALGAFYLGSESRNSSIRVKRLN